MVQYLQGSKTIKINGQHRTSIIDIICNNNEIIHVFPGSLSPNDILLKYKSNRSKRLRTPKHIHLAIDLLIKKSHNLHLTNYLLDVLLERWSEISGLASRDYQTILNNLTISSNQELEFTLNPLNMYGEFQIDFILNFCQLIMLQEKTNRNDAYVFGNLLSLIRNNNNDTPFIYDIYSIVSVATFKSRLITFKSMGYIPKSFLYKTFLFFIINNKPNNQWNTFSI